MTKQLKALLYGSLFVAFMTTAMAVSAYADTLVLASSPEIPAAEGRVRTRVTQNGNTEINLRVKHLAPPDRITPGTAVFVVWVRGLAQGSLAQNLGGLRVNKNLSGKLRGATSLKAFDLFLTCEALQSVTAPTGRELLPVHYAGE